MFKGTGTAIITPFKDSGEVDYSALERIIDHQLQNNIDSLIVLGTTGEAPTIEEEEKEKMVPAIIDQVDGQVPIILGTGSNNARHVLQNNRKAEEWGADGLLIVTPYYNKGTQATLYKYFSYLAGNTDLPIILYNVPSRTGVNLEPETVIQLGENHDNIVAVKEASGDISQIATIIANKPADFKVYSGNDDQALPLIALGGDGLISVASNIIPQQMVELTHNLLDNDLEAARKINNQYMNLMQDLFLETNPIPVKYAASQIGLCQNVLRLPLDSISPENANYLQKLMQELELV
ncbi:MAG TPA: 4-hydroxy-tetrahydrodipicolinate synthase [bacterium]|nr:4-hydroxy-tetrahydrodipicolinate synthase [bacterium]